MRVHLIDGTYELFRQHFGQAGRHTETVPFAATIGVVASTLQLVDDGATHLGVASDHVIESFRNDMWAGYKTSAGMDPELLEQIPLMEQALVAPGSRPGRWSSTRPTTRSALLLQSPTPTRGSTQVLIVTPDKDLGQCVRGNRVVQFDRRKERSSTRPRSSPSSVSGRRRSPTIWRSWVIRPTATPAWPGGDRRVLRPCSPSSARSSTSRRRRATGGCLRLRGAEKLAVTLRDNLELALLFRRIATIEIDVPVGKVDDWHWKGPTPGFAAICDQLGAPHLVERAERIAKRTAPAD